MRNHVRALTRSAVLAALAVVLLYLSSVVPTWRVALAAVAGLAALPVMLEFGGIWALGAFLVSSLLGFLLAPAKGSAILYAVFLGYYPALKCLIERLRSKAAQWAVKLALFNAAGLALYLLAKVLFTDTLNALSVSAPMWLVWIGMNIVFIVYDFGLTGLIRMFVQRFAGRKNGDG